MAQAPRPPEPPARPAPPAHKSTRDAPDDHYETPNENCEHETVADEQRRRSDEAQAAALNAPAHLPAESQAKK